MGKVELVVGGRSYEAWESVRIARSIEAIAASFDLSVSDKWGGQEQPYPISEEDACRVAIDGETVVDGYIDRRSIRYSATERSVSFSGRDRSAVLVDSSALLDRWTFRDATVLDFCRKVTAPFGVPVTLDPAVTLPKAPPKTVVNPGQTAFAAMEAAARAAGVLLVSDGAGGILLTRAARTRAETALVQGENVLAASVDYDATDRFSRYVVLAQTPGTDSSSGPATRIRATASDAEVVRSERALIVRSEAGIPADYARQLADWEARVRAARAATVTVLVRGWKQSDRGRLWPLNAVVPVRIPGIGVSVDLLIVGADHQKDGSGGEVTTLRLVRPDAFRPEPQEAVVRDGSGLWKELRNGAS